MTYEEKANMHINPAFFEKKITAAEINADNLDKWIQSLSDTKIQKKRKRKTSTTTKVEKVCGEQPEIVPENQLNLFNL